MIGPDAMAGEHWAKRLRTGEIVLAADSLLSGRKASGRKR